MGQHFFDARDLWAASGQVPYFEADKITHAGPIIREMIHAGRWRGLGTLRVAGIGILVPETGHLAGAGRLVADAYVV